MAPKVDRAIFVIGPFTWGTGNSVRQARNKARRRLPPNARPLARFIGYVAPADSTVDASGKVLSSGEIIPLGEV